MELEAASSQEEEPPDSPISNKQQKESLRERGSFFVDKNDFKNKVISYSQTKNCFKIRIFNKFEYSLKYPKEIFTQLDSDNKNVILDNFTYCRTIPLIFLSNPGLLYKSKKPFLKNLIHWGVEKDLPRINTLLKTKTIEPLKKQNKTQIIFQEKVPAKKISLSKKCSEKRAILSLSFGKDSLLSYGLLKELGLDYKLVFINDMEEYNLNEWKLKKEIIKTFLKEEKEKVIILTDNTDNIYRNNKIKNNFEEFDGTNAMLAFAMELIPIAYHFKAKYIVFGNERNLDDFFTNSEKIKVYPSYDQSSTYISKENLYLKDLTGNNIEIISLVKPLYNLAEVRILYHRYPYLLKYVMSCSSKKLLKERWCNQCPTCAKAFLYAAAINCDPLKIGIDKNLFEKKYQNLYPLFASKIERIYEMPPQVKDEQILAFLLAWRNGYQGNLIELFKKLYLKEAKKREKELRRKFFGIHSTATIPEYLRNKVVNIYKEELKDLQ